MSTKVQLIECPRDAIQGITHFISAEKKISYINNLIASNLFEYIDFGSFVSPKAVPQMQDSLAVLQGLEKVNDTKLLAIIANIKGAEIVSKLPKIDFVGYPFSISETFQRRNLNATIAESYIQVESTMNLLSSNTQELVIYISMAFGNPYHEKWSKDLVLSWIEKLSNLGIKRFSIADTTSEAYPEQINTLFKELYINFPKLDFSIHLHSKVEDCLLKIEAAYEAGCRRFEGAFLGYGGCPFAKDEMVGNVPMELLLDRFRMSSPQSDVTKLMDDFQYLIKTDEL